MNVCACVHIYLCVFSPVCMCMCPAQLAEGNMTLRKECEELSINVKQKNQRLVFQEQEVSVTDSTQ